MGSRLTIDVWADVLCPWCYLGEQRLGVAIGKSPHAADIDLRIHTFELDPTAPTTGTPLLEMLAKKLGVPTAKAREIEEGMVRLATAEGLPYEMDRLFANTFDMLRLVQLGNAYGLGWDYLRAMQAEMFGGNAGIYQHPTLVRLGEELGLPGAEIRDVLATDRYADEVRADHNAAIRLGARGVPFTVLGNRLGIPGAVSTVQYAAAIDQAWEQTNATR
ncbi:DsbA family oxidoreductase [Actinoplanes sp. TBRC 11911]|uniref:DsbA family oxidoreductase n=1 Tax=Actinoplanes sp. TBRC 11911 TaxID=2729386 RepID=UPI00145EF05C|nr:DsbA family oxidoreductase [Actinoplanes sp. TBRC 11911]NMO49819.1 DsbA family oxidoreductase [Actinoplanes sp. TBRC 11911]